MRVHAWELRMRAGRRGGAGRKRYEHIHVRSMAAIHG
ncbi:MAG: hypothetical protein ACJAQ8_003048, partial [Haliea salexigens]